jgi:hypothetical protein
MKERIKSTPYFSAYSLKALDLPSSEAAVNKKNNRISKVINEVKAFSDPNSEKKISINKINIPATVHSADNNWYNHFE